jgi:hypothetical protein
MLEPGNEGVTLRFCIRCHNAYDAKRDTCPACKAPDPAVHTRKRVILIYRIIIGVPMFLGIIAYVVGSMK